MKQSVWLVSTLLILSGCATGPKNVQVLEVCPKAPPLESDAPVLDWQGWMRNFLQGTPTTLPDYSLPTTNVKLSTTP